MSSLVAAPRVAEPRGELPFSRPFVTGNELEMVSRVLASGLTAGNGRFAKDCEDRLVDLTGSAKVLLTHSCTGALEMAALLADVGPGDEVIMPSFTFVSTANAFVLRGATPVFVDVKPGDMNIDPVAVQAAVTSRTKAIVPVHYGGGAADMESLMLIAESAGALVIEDAAQSVFASWRGKAPGAIGHMGTMSFHETKNLSCGEGGALLINDPAFIERAEVLLEKGTNRTRFVRGEIGSYEWVDVGSSFLMSDLSAAVLGTQLEAGEQITAARRTIWSAYHSALEPLEDAGLLVRPNLAADVEHNGHIYWMLAPDCDTRDEVIARMRVDGVRAQFHYVPLHSAPAGRKYGRTSGSLDRTEDLASRLVRLPVWAGMTDDDVEHVITSAVRAFAPTARMTLRRAA